MVRGGYVILEDEVVCINVGCYVEFWDSVLGSLSMLEIIDRIVGCNYSV